MKKNILSCLAVSLLLILMVGCGAGERETNEITPVFPDYYKLEDLIENSTNIIHAEVQKLNNPTIVNVKTPDGESMKTLYTPVVLEIKEVVRGTMKTSTTTYFQMGGENKELVTTVTGHPLLQQGEEIVIFYDNKGYGWGELSTYRVLDDRVTLNTDKLPDVYSTAVDTETTTFDIDGFKELVRYISVSQGGQVNK